MRLGFSLREIFQKEEATPLQLVKTKERATPREYTPVPELRLEEDPAPDKPVLTLLEADTPATPAPAPDWNHDEHPVGVLGDYVAEVIILATDILSKSCLYFTRDNLAILGCAPDARWFLERLDPSIIAVLMDGQIKAEQGRLAMECKADLFAGLESARLAAQLFGILRDLKTPPSALEPLRKVNDRAMIAMRAAANAVVSGNPATTVLAREIMDETEKLAQKLKALLRIQREYRPAMVCLAIQATAHAILSAAESMVLIAERLTSADPPRLTTVGLLRDE